MAPFLIALMLIFVLALTVVVVVALPHLRAGAPVLTPEGERLARVVNRPVRRLADPLRRRGRERPDRPVGPGPGAAEPFPMPPALAASPYASPSDVRVAEEPAAEPAAAEPDRAAGSAAGPAGDQRMEIDIRWIDAPPSGARGHAASSARRG